MHEEDGQPDVEQDDHTDHDGVRALRNGDTRSVCSKSPLVVQHQKAAITVNAAVFHTNFRKYSNFSREKTC